MFCYPRFEPSSIFVSKMISDRTIRDKILYKLNYVLWYLLTYVRTLVDVLRTLFNVVHNGQGSFHRI